WGPRGFERAVHPPPRSSAAVGRDAPRLADSGPYRRLGRRPGRLRRNRRTAPRKPARAQASPRPPAASRALPGARGAAPPPPRVSDARRTPGGIALPRRTAGSEFGGARGPAPGPTHFAHAGGHSRRAHLARARRAQRPRPRGPGDPVAAPLRGADRG